ncbi:GNAT family N-acetyltransferase [Sphingomonas cavernae]|uniref:N-acetyltransferase n=1 Tax=Sphingomonas cavernae TaxID=2320861 RepID=A0A418WPW6_9SPHN|nr:GNAT family N-acetyltransferase [Sphingomonas cavernae]RJF93288.1 N-acetyltransferase [Sphingomonas cavernae]
MLAAGASVRTELLAGDSLARRLPEIGALRIAVFRDFPYLYEGDPAYEAAYLRPYATSPDALVMGAFDGDRLVGVTTAAPMEDHAEDFAAPFAARGIDISTIYYFGESVLLPQYRGQGIGHAFFDAREERGRALGRRHAAFCAVTRPADHPARPADYAPLDTFWTKRGYARVDGLVAGFAWRDIGDPAETEKPMQFWMKAL